ncbi:MULTISPECIES: hypothetical protein [unclassified Neptuniibacter]|jgi:hypothetical protein|uniref:hypothetical protein n=1 Tax=unclassified Neptuniibacter TaxID=2630693 RepID=UPI0026E1B8E7|nr:MULTISPECIES: hypothetical protein [unclassified Neptuniibacter]MDO6514894.1 hypothetical protein [Neptuniibacter sp. 2_MG-2023]MDO6594528.1 hypothetical protein [Neptuniibacter sp. 1_MG-2023]
MYKVLIWIAFVALGILAVKTQFLTSDTFEPFKEGCMQGEGATEERCDCLAKYVHKHFSDNEVKLIMSNQLSDPDFKLKVEEVVNSGSIACAAE